MNIFYAPPSQISNDVIELIDQEAKHASKALRYKQGDRITIVDGDGGWYQGEIQLIADQSVRVIVKEISKPHQPQPKVILGMGIIKKGDRLEFAVEKAVELGVKEIALFKGDHTIKKNVRVDRLESIVLSAMKQSLRAWRPRIHVYNSLKQVTEQYQEQSIIAAHEVEEELMDTPSDEEKSSSVLLVGPEGGFSDSEIGFLKNKKVSIVSLGTNRLRTETAAITLLNQFNYLNRG